MEDITSFLWQESKETNAAADAARNNAFLSIMFPAGYVSQGIYAALLRFSKDLALQELHATCTKIAAVFHLLTRSPEIIAVLIHDSCGIVDFPFLAQRLQSNHAKP